MCVFAAFSFYILVSKELAGNLSQSIPLFEHSKSPVHSMENAQLSFIDQREWTNSVAFEVHGCHSNWHCNVYILDQNRLKQFSSPRWSAL